MSQVQLNRSGVVGHVPATLLSGAMFYNSADAKLYIGDINDSPTLVSDNPLVIASQIAALQQESRGTTVSEIAPAEAAQGDLWYDLATNQLKFYTTEWVLANSVVPVTTGLNAIFPVTTNEFLAHIVYTTTDETELNQVITMIDAATQIAERITGRMFISRNVTQLYDGFPENVVGKVSPFILKGGLANSVASVTYIDSQLVSQQLPASAYRIVNKYGRSLVYPAMGTAWPTDIANEVDSVSITFSVGTPAPSVPAPVKMAILMIAASLWENRENEAVGPNLKALKPAIAAKDLLHPYKLR